MIRLRLLRNPQTRRLAPMCLGWCAVLLLWILIEPDVYLAGLRASDEEWFPNGDFFERRLRACGRRAIPAVVNECGFMLWIKGYSGLPHVLAKFGTPARFALQQATDREARARRRFCRALALMRGFGDFSRAPLAIQVAVTEDHGFQSAIRGEFSLRYGNDPPPPEMSNGTQGVSPEFRNWYGIQRKRDPTLPLLLPD